MEGNTELGDSVPHLLDEANVLVLAALPNVTKARNLIGLLRECANQVTAAGAEYEGVEGRLRGAADSLELKVGKP